MQKQIEFNRNHPQENNIESDVIYTVNLDALNNNNRIIFEQLLTGAKLTGIDCARLGILEYRRRFLDLKQIYKIPVKDEMVPGKRYKRWFLNREWINKYLGA